MQAYRIDDWAVTEFGDAELGDARRTARLTHLATVLGAQPTASLPDATDDPATLTAADRFFANEAVDPAQILASHVQATTARLRQVPLVLAVQDTTYLDWTHHPATTGLGPLAQATQQGLLAHTTLALTPDRVPLGLRAQEVWARDPATFAQQVDHKQRSITANESQQWLTSVAAVAQLRDACPTTQVVSVGDADADVYALFPAPRPAGVDLLVRAVPEAPGTALLDDDEGQALWCAIHRRAPPPTSPPPIRTAVRWIAQLGGFLGRKGDGDQGVTVLWHGVQQQSLCRG